MLQPSARKLNACGFGVAGPPCPSRGLIAAREAVKRPQPGRQRRESSQMRTLALSGRPSPTRLSAGTIRPLQSLRASRCRRRSQRREAAPALAEAAGMTDQTARPRIEARSKAGAFCCPKRNSSPVPMLPHREGTRPIREGRPAALKFRKPFDDADSTTPCRASRPMNRVAKQFADKTRRFQQQSRARYWRNPEKFRAAGRSKAATPRGRQINAEAVADTSEVIPNGLRPSHCPARDLWRPIATGRPYARSTSCADDGPLHAHHSNYARPLDVVFLCRAP